MIQLLTNQESSGNHQTRINDLLRKSTEAYIAVAFLKDSGLKLIENVIEQRRMKISFLAGINFGLTDPEALGKLLSYSQKSNRLSVYIRKLSSTTVFHPKIFLIKTKLDCHIIVGSTNLTKGGLSDNDECSLHVQCSERDTVWIDALSYFTTCINPNNADVLNERLLAIYRQYQRSQKWVQAKAEPFPDVSNNLIYNLAKLKDHYAKIDSVQLRRDFAQKRRHYREARKVLDSIANQNRKSVFKNLIEDLVGKAGFPGLWYSNGMYRHKGKIFQQQELFKDLIVTIKTHLKSSPAHIYEEALKVIRQTSGVGPNFIGEILMTYAPDKFANINQNPITVLREEGDVDLKVRSTSFTGKDYEEYNAVVKEIAFALGLKDMLEADYFFNSIYQEIKGRLNS